MKKNRYSKAKGKEVPSRRKLAMEAHKLQVEVEQRRHELRCQREDLEVTREERRTWRGRAEMMREENEKLRKQVEELMPDRRYLHVTPVRGFRRGELEESLMRRTTTVHLPRAHLVVEVGMDHFRMMEGRDAGAYKEALAEHLARQAYKVVMEGLEMR